jgi:secreted trypsin-like serine protease
MRRRPRLVLFGALAAAAALLVSASASAQSDGTVQPKVVGGSTASVSTYPWQAAVVFAPSKRSGNAHQRQFCGGSLLTSRIVVTAGHCVADTDPNCTFCGSASLPPICTPVSDPSPGDGTCKLDADDVDVVLGRSTLSDTGQGAELSVQAVKLQDNFDGDYQGDGVPRFDVAYLVLSSAPSLTPIKIAGTDEGALWDPGSPADVSGWGSTSEVGGTVDTLRAARVNVIDDSTCGADYGVDFDSATMVCAGFQSGGVDTCFGDSGGPLEAPLSGGGYRLVGITSWGDGCAEPGAPGVYTRVAGPAMRSLIESDVSSLESANGLPAEPIFGGGGQPIDSAAPPATAQPASAANPLKKCKRIRDKKKRRRCIKKVKKRIRAGT